MTAASTGEPETERLRALVQEIPTMLDPAGGTTATVEYLHDRSAVRERFRALQRSARREVRGCNETPSAAIPQAATHSAHGPLRALPTEKVTYRILHDMGVLSAPCGVDRMRRAESAGEQLRFLSGLPVRLIVADDKAAMVGMPGPVGGVEAAVIGPSVLLSALIATFEALWSSASPYTLRAMGDIAPVGAVVDPVDHELLALFAAGVTDTGVARRTGLSLRTVQRRMTRIAKRLGTTTRFQTAVHAARRGWI